MDYNYRLCARDEMTIDHNQSDDLARVREERRSTSIARVTRNSVSNENGDDPLPYFPCDARRVLVI